MWTWKTGVYTEWRLVYCISLRQTARGKIYGAGQGDSYGPNYLDTGWMASN